MGWVTAVGLFQHLHRRLGLASPPSGAGHKEESEWVEFVDNVDKKIWKRIQVTLSTPQRNLKKTCQHVGVEVSDDKSHGREPRVVCMGGPRSMEFRDSVGLLRKRLLKLLGFVFGS